MEFTVKKALERSELVISKVKVTALDRRTQEQEEHVILILGSVVNTCWIRRALDNVGFNLIDCQLMETRREAGLQNAFGRMGASGFTNGDSCSGWVPVGTPSVAFPTTLGVEVTCESKGQGVSESVNGFEGYLPQR